MHLSRHRMWSAVACVLVAGSAAATDAGYLQLPGLVGPSTASRYTGWFDVTQDTIVLLPGTFNGDRSAVVSQCTATIRTQLGGVSATIAKLVGTHLGAITLDRISSRDALPLYHAVLHNAVLTGETSTFDSGIASDTLSLRFDAIDVTTYQRNPDGSVGRGTQGWFDCLVVP